MTDKNKRLRIGVSGIGSIGFRHTRLLSQKGRVDICVADPVEAHRAAAKELPGVAFATDSFDELLGSGLDGLIISTPDHLHVPQAEAACRQGIAVLVEKPITGNLAECESLVNTIAKTDAKVLVGYPLRHNSVFRKAKELLDQGDVGEPVSFQIILGSYATLVAAKNRFDPSDRNKLFVDYSHEWDYLQWFLGTVDRVIAVSHTSGRREKKQVPNVVNSLLEMRSGISGTAHLDYVQSPGTRMFTVVGDEGVLTIDAPRTSIIVQRYNDEFEREYRVAETFDSMMLRQIEHFLDVIDSSCKPKVTVEDGVRALQVAEALIRSTQTNSWQSV